MSDIEREVFAPLDDKPGPARRISSRDAASMIDAALDAASLPAKVDSETQADPREPARIPRRLRLLLVAALLLVVIGGASAYVLTSLPPRGEGQGGGTSTTAEQSVFDREREPEPPPEPEPQPQPEQEPQPEPETEPAAEPTPEPPVDRRRVRRSDVDIDTGPADAPVEDLLRLANERRGAKRWRAADAVYRRVLREHPRTRAAYVATLASADIRLRHLGQPGAAAALYRRALDAAPAGALAEEARWGLAEAHRARGDAAAERAALRAFLDHHDDSPMAPRARARISELDRAR